MNKTRMIVLVVIVSSFIMMGIPLRSLKPAPLDEAIPSDDPVLKKIQDQNPGIRMEKRRRDRNIPVFWAIEPKTGQSATIPRSYADTQEQYRIEFVPCSAAKIPEQLLYENPVEKVCVALSDDRYHYDAVFFRASGRIQDLVKYYAPKAGETYFNSIHGAYGEGSVIDPHLSEPEGFRYAFSLYEIPHQKDGGWQTLALISYRMVKKPE